MRWSSQTGHDWDADISFETPYWIAKEVVHKSYGGVRVGLSLAGGTGVIYMSKDI
jgi:hypothetical protein